MVAGTSVLVMAVAAMIAGPWSVQTGVLIVLLGWVVAVIFGRWAYRGRSKRAVAMTRVAVVLAVLSTSLTLALLLVGVQVRDLLAGSIVFGASGSECSLDTEAESFALGEPVYAVAYLDRVVESGEEVRLLVTREGQFVREAADVSSRSFDCLGSALKASDIGTYTVAVSAGAETLAEGGFEVTPVSE
jgi:hypothetical protein